MYQKINALLSKIKKEKPLILNITNQVTMDFIANGLLSMGASPIMSAAKEEIAELVNYSKAVVINIGTLNQDFMQLCEHTCKIANAQNIPIILDPVGAGATRYRTQFCNTLLTEYPFAVIRGNASEIMALTHTDKRTKGVDSLAESHEAYKSASELSKAFNTTIVISGREDFIIKDDYIKQFSRGSSLMPMITGSGCLLTSVIAAFTAYDSHYFEAAELATLFYNICGEIAAANNPGPGLFKQNFLDALATIPDPSFYE